MCRGAEGSTPIDSGTGSPAGVGKIRLYYVAHTPQILLPSLLLLVQGVGSRFYEECCKFFIRGGIINVLVKDIGFIEDDILRNAATSVRSIIKPWSDLYVGMSMVVHEYARNRQR